MVRVRLLAVLLAVLCAWAAEPAERDVAEWILRIGGSVIVEGNPRVITRLTDLPAGELRVRTANLVGTLMEPAELARIGRLTGLRELLLPGPSWNPGAGSNLDANQELKALAGLKELEKLHFSLHFLTNINVRDKGLAHLHALKGLESLYLDGTRATDDGKNRLIRALPDVHLHFEGGHHRADPHAEDHEHKHPHDDEH